VAPKKADEDKDSPAALDDVDGIDESLSN
jgi:hypothetical protein